MEWTKLITVINLWAQPSILADMDAVSVLVHRLNPCDYLTRGRELGKKSSLKASYL